jgi:small-conductance mechanosensitive channel
VALQADLDAAQRAGLQTIAQTPGVLADPEPVAYIQQVGGSAVQIDFYGWVNQRQSNRLAVRSDALRRVKVVLDAAGMETSPTSVMKVQLERLVGDAPGAGA